MARRAANGRYELLTTWCVDAPLERVYDLIGTPTSYPRWWRGVESVVTIEPGDADSIGRVDRFRWRSVLPYAVTFDARVVRVEGPHLIAAEVTGDLEGVGTWRLYGGLGAVVVYDWRVRATASWMRALDPVAHRAFRWNHDRVMAQGAFGLARELGVELLASGSTPRGRWS